MAPEKSDEKCDEKRGPGETETHGEVGGGGLARQYRGEPPGPLLGPPLEGSDLL